MGEGNGEKLFYLTARNTTQTAAEDALTRLHTAQPELALRSVTLTAKERSACIQMQRDIPPAYRSFVPTPTATTTASRMH